MKNILLILLGKTIIVLSRIFNLGSGSTWPGHIALKFNKDFIRDMLNKSHSKDRRSFDQRTKLILIAGTNGKTTTAKILETILEKNGDKVFRNTQGANLLNGIASSLIAKSGTNAFLDYDYAIFEMDENSLPLILKTISPDIIILNNLFRDQLDRYGEIDTIVKRWKKELEKLPKTSFLILNADDPQIASLGEKNASVSYFGLQNKNLAKTSLEHAVDSVYCPKCESKLSFLHAYFSHLGVWQCNSCGYKRPKIDLAGTNSYPLPGIYNMYNTLAAILSARKLGVKNHVIEKALKDFKPAFGRQEKIIVGNKIVQIFLSKNPTSFNQSLRTIKLLKGKSLLIVLNNRIPDGRDVSWIWDTEIEELIFNFKNITVSGDRTYDMALRLKYASSSKYQISNIKYQIKVDLREAIESALEQVGENETLYVLPTYSAMLEVRKILTGRTIL